MAHTITLNGESALLTWRNGKIYSEGYDLESEKMALALNNNLGEGIGTLLVAIDEYFDKEVNLKKMLAAINEGLTKIETNSLVASVSEWKDSPLFVQYLTYSPNVSYRRKAAFNAKLRYAGFKRLAKDKEVDVLWSLARRIDLPKDLYETLYKSPHYQVRKSIGENHSTPKRILHALSGDESVSVRRGVAENWHCPPKLQIKLGRDEDVRVQETVFTHRELPKQVQLELIKTCSVKWRNYLGKFSFHSEVLRILAIDENDSVRAAARANAYTPPRVANAPYMSVSGRELD